MRVDSAIHECHGFPTLSSPTTNWHRFWLFLFSLNQPAVSPQQSQPADLKAREVGTGEKKYIEQLSSSSSSWFCHRRHDQPARAEAEEQLDRCNENGVPCLGWSACTWVGLVVISNVNVNVIISNVNVIKMISLTKHLQTPHQTPTCSMQRAGHSWGRLGLPTEQHPWMSWQLGLIWRWRWWLWWWWQLWRQQ